MVEKGGSRARARLKATLSSCRGTWGTLIEGKGGGFESVIGKGKTSVSVSFDEGNQPVSVVWDESHALDLGWRSVKKLKKKNWQVRGFFGLTGIKGKRRMAFCEPKKKEKKEHPRHDVSGSRICHPQIKRGGERKKGWWSVRVKKERILRLLQRGVQ